ncbi:ANTAR domain-containing protein [Mycobacterium sp. 1274761.0]|uniref:ANTAR domain-containing protein n=1 Tax=Mycobacterium sp. 1274761.0 TaxID=1834077 RepID=UPI000800D8B7|nr:ANTAR domain-containing protein [Mycobacterium sp. 1274761.0]OBK76771.1 hypothetical protein A5651_05970 [Mycobacterium sp. 1274761.0]
MFADPPAAPCSNDELRRELWQLECKLASQAVIEQAKGMLMGAFGLSSDHSFEVLKCLSQSNNIKLREVAHYVVQLWTSRGPRADVDEASAFLVALHRHLASESNVS